MKAFATAAVLMMLSAPAWADEATKNESNSNEPIILSEAELDGVTAGADGIVGMQTWSAIRESTDPHHPTEEVAFYYNNIKFGY